MKPYYYSLNEYLKNTYNCKMYKLALNGGMTCPNRDGFLDTRGCIFCSSGGSGDFAGDKILSFNPQNYNDYISKQLFAAKNFLKDKYHGNDYIAYFQSYTNTYAPVSYLRKVYYEAANDPEVKIISIATRPDCFNDEIYSLLDELNQFKPVWIELGLQTIHEKTAQYIRRGYPLSTFDNTIKRLNSLNIKTIVHMITGLPGENLSMMLETAQYIAHSKAFGIKLQLLHVLKNTDLEKDYINGLFKTMELDEYIFYTASIIEHLPKDMVIHRLTGDGPKKLLVAPQWSCNKKNVMNSMNKYFKENNIYQGRLFQ